MPKWLRYLLYNLWFLAGVYVAINWMVVLQYSFMNKKNYFIQVDIKGQEFFLEVADTNKKREKWLMWRKSMNENQGMIFVFDEEKEQSFWMKNTLIPLDMIWLDSSNTITEIQTTIPCKTEFCKSYLGVGDKVIELNGGMANKLWIKVGDTIKMKAFK